MKWGQCCAAADSLSNSVLGIKLQQKNWKERQPLGEHTVFDINVVSPFQSHRFHMKITFYPFQSTKCPFYLEDERVKLLIFSCTISWKTCDSTSLLVVKLSKYGHLHVNTLPPHTNKDCYICSLILAMTSCKWDSKQTMWIDLQSPHQSSNQLFPCFISLIIDTVAETGIVHLA